MKAIIPVCKLRKKVLKKIKNIASSQNNFHCTVQLVSRQKHLLFSMTAKLD